MIYMLLTSIVVNCIVPGGTANRDADATILVECEDLPYALIFDTFT